MSPKKEHIVIFPYMAQGHINPFLSLALKLEQEKGCAVTFINTPININKLAQILPEISAIRLLEIPFETTETDLPLPFKVNLLKPAFRNVISRLVDGGDPPLCIISDIFFAWSVVVAHEFGVVHAIFHAGGGYGMAALHTTWLNLPHLKADSGEFWLPGFPKFYKFKSENLSKYVLAAKKPWKFALEMFDYWKETDAMLFNTVENFDHTGLNYFRDQFLNCSVYAVGPILSAATAGVTSNHIIDWLDSKPKNSVLYVAFGSQSSPSRTQTLELAKALEASNINFLWVFKPSSKFTDSSTDNENWLPIGFEEAIRASNKGLLVKSWAPQMQILSHSSIGGFLSNCGWNSTMEALSNGVPMLSWPMSGEQPFNAQFLEEEMRVCIGVANGVTGKVKHEDLVRKIKLVMEDDEGKVMRRKACRVKEVIKNAINDEGSSFEAFNSFVNTRLYMGSFYHHYRRSCNPRADVSSTSNQVQKQSEADDNAAEAEIV